MNTLSERNFLLEQFKQVNDEIENTCHSTGRDPGEIRLIVVSKFQPESRIRWLLEASQRNFAESRINEIEQKWLSIFADYPDAKLHFIGQLQSRKIKLIVKYCHMIHSLDRIDIAEKIAEECRTQNKKIDCLVQINIGDEPQKSGVHPDSLPDFLEKCKTISPLSIKGIMCIPPVNKDPTPYFQLMYQLKNNFNLPELSMGMSDDYQKAIACGATMVRIGTKIMGDRKS